MVQFAVNARRADPYRNFRFLLKWDGRYVAGVSKVSTLKSKVSARHRDGGDLSTKRKSPGLSKFEPITLERGLSLDPEFGQWANASASGEATLGDFRRDLIVEMLDETGKLAGAYRIFRCWVSEYQALPDADANASAVAIQHLKLENEGWEHMETPEELSAGEPAAE